MNQYGKGFSSNYLNCHKEVFKINEDMGNLITNGSSINETQQRVTWLHGTTVIYTPTVSSFNVLNYLFWFHHCCNGRFMTILSNILFDVNAAFYLTTNISIYLQEDGYQYYLFVDLSKISYSREKLFLWVEMLPVFNCMLFIFCSGKYHRLCSLYTVFILFS